MRTGTEHTGASWGSHAALAEKRWVGQWGDVEELEGGWRGQMWALEKSPRAVREQRGGSKTLEQEEGEEKVEKTPVQTGFG